jgi:predicted nucleic acid-binding protein
MSKKPEKKIQLILDSNAFQYGCDGKYSEWLLDILTGLEDKYEFALSSITNYEFFAGLTVNGKKGMKRMKDGKNFLATFENIPISNDHLRIAAALRTLYKCNDSTKSFEHGINFADGLIAAVAISLRAHILTGNSNDFPSPFFDEKQVSTMKPPAEKQQKISVVAPDIDYFDAELKRIYPKN